MGFLFGSHHPGHQSDGYHHHYQYYGHSPGYGHPQQHLYDVGGPSQGHQVPYGYQGYQPIYHQGHYPIYHQQGHSPEPYPYNQAHYGSQYHPYSPYQQTPAPYQPFIYDEPLAMTRENDMNQEDSY